MDLKIDKIKDILSKQQRLKNPPPKVDKPNRGNGYTSGKLANSVLSRTAIFNQHTAEDVLGGDDERLENSALLKLQQEQFKLSEHIKSLTGKRSNTKFGHDQDRIYMGLADDVEAGHDVAVSRQSFFRDQNKFNVVSQKGRQISRMEEAMLYK